MKKPISVILIDPAAKSLATVQWDQELDSLYAFLNCKFVEAHNILSLGDPVTVFCDEEYWMMRPPQKQTYPATLFPSCVPMAGRLLVTGESDGDGGVLSCPIEVADLKDMIRFCQTTHPHERA
jgi:hypothetical protein